MLHSLESLMPLIEAVRQLKGNENRVYLVGGAVRDLLLQQGIHDLDFAGSGDMRKLARRFADRFQGGFFMLDAERETARVALNQSPYAGLILDFAHFRAADLEGDLLGRDFTVNAMALDLEQLDHLIDPLGGAADLQRKELRLCSAGALEDDPVRTLRAVRMAVNYELRMLPDTIRLIRSTAKFLARVSPERQRDELFYILGGRRVATALRLLDQLGILPLILPELAGIHGVKQGSPHVYDVWEHTLRLVDALENLLGVVASTPALQDISANLNHGLAALRLGRFRTQLSSLMNAPITSTRPRRALLFFGALFHDIAKPEMRTVGEDGRVHFYGHDARGEEIVAARAQSLALSQDEITYLRMLVRQHMRIHFLMKRESRITRRIIYRYFRDLGEVGVDICLHSLADLQATNGPEMLLETWISELDICRELLESWYEKPEQAIEPPRLLSGHDLIAAFGFSPGPLVGELLEAVREAQAAGEVQSRDEALTFVRKILEEKQPPDILERKTGLTDISVLKLEEIQEKNFMSNEPVKLHYREYGKGTPLVLVHGYPLNHSIWNEVAAGLQDCARVILPDLRGFGRSAAPEGVYSMRLLADDLRQLMDDLEVEKAVLVGHSMGGYVSLAFAQAYPERLAGFGMVGSQAEADAPERRQGRYQTAEEVKIKGVRGVADVMSAKLSAKSELVEPLRQLILHVATVNGVVGTLQGMAERPDATGWLSSITVPAVVIAGKEDAIIPTTRAHTLAQLLGRGWLVEIEGVGHMPMMEAPEQVIGALRELLSHLA